MAATHIRETIRAAVEAAVAGATTGGELIPETGGVEVSQPSEDVETEPQLSGHGERIQNREILIVVTILTRGSSVQAALTDAANQSNVVEAAVAAMDISTLATAALLIGSEVEIQADEPIKTTVATAISFQFSTRTLEGFPEVKI